MKPNDPLDGAQLVSFDDRSTVDAFARAAAAHFLATASHRTFTKPEIHPHLLAIRWGVADQAVLVCQIDEAFTPLIYMDCLPDRGSASQHIGDIRWSFAVGPREKGLRVPLEDVAREASLVVHSVLRVMMRTLGWPEDLAAAVAQRAGGRAADEVRFAYGGPSGKRFRIRPKRPTSDVLATTLVIDKPGEPTPDNDGRGLTFEEASAVANCWNNSGRRAAAAEDTVYWLTNGEGRRLPRTAMEELALRRDGWADVNPDEEIAEEVTP